MNFTGVLLIELSSIHFLNNDDIYLHMNLPSRYLNVSYNSLMFFLVYVLMIMIENKLTTASLSVCPCVCLTFAISLQHGTTFEH